MKFFSIIGNIIESIAQTYLLEGSIATIKEVAKKAGVSVSTVSHVVNKTRFVSDHLRNKVLSVIERLEYQPNQIARSLRRKSSNSLGLIIADITNPFFSEMARSIDYHSFMQNYSIILCNSGGNKEKEALYINRWSEWQVDGIIIVSSSLPPYHLSSLSKPEMPITLVDMDCPGYTMDSISVDNFSGGKLAAEHLISLGHKRIACIYGSLDTKYKQERVNGFRAAMNEAGIEVEEPLIARADFDIGSSMNVALRLLEMENRPTAIFVCGDLMAYGAMQAAFIKDLKIPDDLSVVGFDDIYISKYTLPPLTTVKQPIDEMAEEAVKCFLGRREDPGKTSRIVKLNPQLEIRSSTAPLM